MVALKMRYSIRKNECSTWAAKAFLGRVTGEHRAITFERRGGVNGKVFASIAGGKN